MVQTVILKQVCRICGRPLENVKSVQNGIGPVCYRKHSTRVNNEGTLNKYLPVPLEEELAEFFRKQMTIHRCRFCGTDLDHITILHYEHSDGWDVPGHSEKQWLIIICPKCKHEWSLWKLGVDR